jgi:RNA polymerase sigma-70 factor (ECF subfamily)
VSTSDDKTTAGPRLHPSDEELLKRFNEGDADAFEVLVRRYERPLYNFILRSVRRKDGADELLQDVFLKVVQRSRDFKGNSKLSTWLYTIARNLCIDHSRKMVFRRHKSLDAPSRPDEDSAPSLLDRTATGEAGIDRQTIAKDLRIRIAAAVEELPEEQREVFLMRQVQGMAFKDIADVIGVPENTVKSRMRYALERLQRALEEYRDYVEELK